MSMGSRGLAALRGFHRAVWSKVPISQRSGVYIVESVLLLDCGTCEVYHGALYCPVDVCRAKHKESVAGLFAYGTPDTDQRLKIVQVQKLQLHPGDKSPSSLNNNSPPAYSLFGGCQVWHNKTQYQERKPM